jgi:hypothetical protein
VVGQYEATSSSHSNLVVEAGSVLALLPWSALTLRFFPGSPSAARQIPLADEPQIAISVAGLRHNFCGIILADLPRRPTTPP